MDTVLSIKEPYGKNVQIIKYDGNNFEIENIFPNSFMVRYQYENGYKSIAKYYSFDKESWDFILKEKEVHFYDNNNLLKETKVFSILEDRLLYSYKYVYEKL